MIDPEEQTVTVVRAGEADVVVRDRLTWSTSGAAAPLELEVGLLFR